MHLRIKEGFPILQNTNIPIPIPTKYKNMNVRDKKELELMQTTMLTLFFLILGTSGNFAVSFHGVSAQGTPLWFFGYCPSVSWFLLINASY